MHVLDIESLTPVQINEIFRLADQLRTEPEGSLLAGKTFVLFFPGTSLRTRASFEKGIHSLGGQCLLFPPETLDTREQLGDVIQYVQNWADGVIVRYPEHSKLLELSKHSAIPIINAMTAYNHPCEILSDLYALSRAREDYRELVYTFVGPASNISRSWMQMAQVMNLAFHHVCTAGNELAAESPAYRFHTDLDAVLPASDVILTDSLPAAYKTEAYITNYQINLERMKRTKPGALLNPCPPFFRGEEVSEEVIASSYFTGYAFKKNLLVVQQAILVYALGH
ncbi:ornithine carbamoyltransferase [Paenibacillus filicis]|uniref:Ornithine carbamoyltransferase n=1 Tax=Paenibacillus filicis TaxID=669464 RepID=A0ABU9DRB1_9BACL